MFNAEGSWAPDGSCVERSSTNRTPEWLPTKDGEHPIESQPPDGRPDPLRLAMWTPVYVFR